MIRGHNSPIIPWSKGKQTNSIIQLKLNYHDSGTKSELIHTYSYQKEYRLPKTDFPRFDGERPRICKENSEKHFAMYKVLLAVNFGAPNIIITL
jgi:hypothetical protein